MILWKCENFTNEVFRFCWCPHFTQFSLSVRSFDLSFCRECWRCGIVSFISNGYLVHFGSSSTYKGRWNWVWELFNIHTVLTSLGSRSTFNGIDHLINGLDHCHGISYRYWESWLCWRPQPLNFPESSPFVTISSKLWLLARVQPDVLVIHCSNKLGM